MTLKEKYGEEKVMSIATNFIKIEENNSSNIRNLFNSIDDHGYFEYRYRAETDYSLKQVIPYLVIKCKDKYFVTKRLKGDSRLVGQMSIGTGGHIDFCDATNIKHTDFGKAENLVINCINRELKEETTVFDNNESYSCSFVNVFSDETNDVSKVHVCLLCTIDVEKEFDIKETKKLEGKWLTKEDIEKDYDKYEKWSQIAIDMLF